VFNEEVGVEKIWLIWSQRSVAEMEEIKRWANPKDKGLVGDPSQIKRVAQYLKALAAAEVEVERDEAGQRTKLKGKGEVLAGVVRLEHRITAYFFFEQAPGFRCMKTVSHRGHRGHRDSSLLLCALCGYSCENRRGMPWYQHFSTLSAYEKHLAIILSVTQLRASEGKSREHHSYHTSSG